MSQVSRSPAIEQDQSGLTEAGGKESTSTSTSKEEKLLPKESFNKTSNMSDEKRLINLEEKLDSIDRKLNKLDRIEKIQDILVREVDKLRVDTHRRKMEELERKLDRQRDVYGERRRSNGCVVS
jgi:predicted RNase H-like nuclease (RuvC/YqgF family)